MGRTEDLQFTLNQGACVQAAATGAPVLVPDLSDSTEALRWPVFAAAVADAVALFALPLQSGAVNLGVLKLYRRTPGRAEPRSVARRDQRRGRRGTDDARCTYQARRQRR